MTKIKRNVAEDNIQQVIDTQENEGWEFVSVAQSSAAWSVIGEWSHRSGPATYLLVFRKNEQQHNDVP